MGASVTPRKKRTANRPALLCVTAVNMRTAPHIKLKEC